MLWPPRATIASFSLFGRGEQLPSCRSQLCMGEVKVLQTQSVQCVMFLCGAVLPTWLALKQEAAGEGVGSEVPSAQLRERPRRLFRSSTSLRAVSGGSSCASSSGPRRQWLPSSGACPAQGPAERGCSSPYPAQQGPFLRPMCGEECRTGLVLVGLCLSCPQCPSQSWAKTAAPLEGFGGVLHGLT